MDSIVRELLLGIGLFSAFVTGTMAPRAIASHGSGSIPFLTLTCFVIIASFSFAQLVIEPLLLPLLMRDTTLIYSGQPWRLMTSLLVQDGGWTGTAFNLVGLVAIGTVAERALGRLQWTATAAIAVAGAQAAALLWQHNGAGNSIVNFGLAGGVCAACLTSRPAGRMFVPAIIASACFVCLLVWRDIHGVAATIGALVVSVLSLMGRKRATGRSAV